MIPACVMRKTLTWDSSIARRQWRRRRVGPLFTEPGGLHVSLVSVAPLLEVSVIATGDTGEFSDLSSSVLCHKSVSCVVYDPFVNVRTTYEFDISVLSEPKTTAAALGNLVSSETTDVHQDSLNLTLWLDLSVMSGLTMK